MVATPLLFAASSILALTHGAPISRSKSAPRSLVERAAYSVFGGDGTTASGWPEESAWKSFEDLWTINEPIMKQSCSQFNVENNSDQEISDIKAGLDSASQTSGVSKQFLLAIMMQESKGCVRAPTTNYGVRNPGLMQDHDGAATCNEGGVQNPCPSNLITQMLTEGATSSFGLKQTIEQSQASDVSKYYKGARIYNSGSIDGSGNLGAGIATHCYASDVANRLMGWADEASSCEEGTIGSLTGSAGGAGNSNEETENNDNTGNTGEAPEETPEETPAQTGGESTPSGTKAEGASANCKTWYTVESGDNCSTVASSAGIDTAKLESLNAGLDSACKNLWLGYSYCVAG